MLLGRGGYVYVYIKQGVHVGWVGVTLIRVRVWVVVLCVQVWDKQHISALPV